MSYHHQDRAPGRYEATALLGPALHDSATVATVLYDNGGGHRGFNVVPTPDAGVILLRDSSMAASRTERFTFRARARDDLWFGWEIQHNGTWLLGDSLSCRRADP